MGTITLTLSRRKSGLIPSRSYCVDGASRVAATALHEQDHMMVIRQSHKTPTPVVGLEVHEGEG